MTKKTTEIPFAELAHRAVQDRAMRELQNPDASPENLAAARAALRAPHAPNLDLTDELRQIPPATVLAIRDLLRAAQERRTGLPVPPPSPLAADPPTPDAPEND